VSLGGDGGGVFTIDIGSAMIAAGGGVRGAVGGSGAATGVTFEGEGTVEDGGTKGTAIGVMG